VGEVIALIDYGAGNLHSVENALRKVGAKVKVTADPDVVRAADRIVLPGVGSFRACAEGLRAEAGVVEAMHERVFVGGAPFLGICVGMQLLATRGLEHGETPGLGWIDGTVRLIEPTDTSVKVPHMGWNDVAPMPHARNHDVVVLGEAYFLHSYHFKAAHHEDVLAMTDHGGGLVAAVGRDNLVGVQFHPEKSQAYGLDLLAKFLEWKP
jgi:glutamine amidotransferase